jgi:tetratricopeptide (TPR) repeat protein
LAKDFPSLPVNWIELAMCYDNLGNMKLNSGKPEDSLAWFQKAIDSLSPLQEKQPREVRVTQVLRGGYLGRAAAYDRLKKHAAAVKDWDRVIELSEKREQPKFRPARAISLLKAGRVAEAVADVAELANFGWSAAQWYDFACVYSVASGEIAGKKAEYSNRAMVLLQKAVKLGFRDASHMAKDPDLDPLRDREDFQKLIASLPKPMPKQFLRETAPPPRAK